MKIFEVNRNILFLSIIISFILYGNTLGHQYALDDAIVITKNEFTQQGLNGIADIFTHESFTGFFGRNKELVSGGRYRPLSIATFAIEYEFFGNNPFLSHLINLLLYAIIGFLIYIVFTSLFKNKLGESFAKKISLLAALIFLIHPIHTECVANIKGRDELLSLLFSLWAFLQIIRFHEYKKIQHIILAPVLLFSAMLAKENAITFVVIIPLALWFFTKSKPISIINTAIILFSSAILFIMVRTSVIGGLSFDTPSELMNNPFLAATNTQRTATILYTWLIYFKLLLFPHPLTFDYYPYHIPIVDFTKPAVILSSIILVAFVILIFWGLKSKKIIIFSILAFTISFSIVSNLVFSIGTFMNERFVFMPSVFWCLGFAYLLIIMYDQIKSKKLINYTSILVLGYLLIFYPIKTISRNKAWKDDLTLFTTDVLTSKNSAKSNCSAGGKLWESGKEIANKEKQKSLYVKSEKYLRKAVKIHPNYADAWLLLGNLLFDAKNDTEGSALCYMNVLKIQPQNKNAWRNIDIVLQNSNDRQIQLNYYQQLQNLDPNKYIINYRLGVLHGRYFNNLNKGIKYLEQAVQIDATKIEALKDLGTAYGIAQMPEKAYVIFNELLELDKTDPQIYINMGIACSQLNKHEEAETYFLEAKKLKKE